jgi:hypothetical protein
MRFESKYLPHPVTGCWTWLAAKTADGYGVFWHDGLQLRAHRFVYEVYRGEIPEDLQIDHLCRNRGCVNPYHLEAVTAKVNIERGRGSWTHCARGHEIDGLNSAGKRFCKECQRERFRRWEAQYYRQRDASGRRVRKPPGETVLL